MKYGTLLFSMVFLSCASVSGTRDTPLDEGEVRLYRAPLIETRDAATKALLGAGLTMGETSQVDPGTWMLVATRGGSVLAYGEIVRVVVASENAELSRVRVVTRKRAALNVTAESDYSDEIFELMTLELGSPIGPWD